MKTGALEIVIYDPATAYRDVLKVNGAVNLVGDDGLLNGLLQVVLGFAPSLNDEFVIVENDGVDPIIGAFSTWTTVKAQFNSRLYQFEIDYASGDGNDIALLAQTESVLGDYNNNGIVDAADYVVWRTTRESMVASYFGADGSGDGIVNDADYLVWRANFGRTLSGNSTTTTIPRSRANVPEPTTGTITILALLSIVVSPKARTRVTCGGPRIH